MNQSLFIVWRESVEALLVIGILQVWISRQAEHSRLGRFLWAGVVLGLLCSAGLAGLMLWAGEAMTGPQGEWLQAALQFPLPMRIEDQPSAEKERGIG